MTTLPWNLYRPPVCRREERAMRTRNVERDSPLDVHQIQEQLRGDLVGVEDEPDAVPSLLWRVAWSVALGLVLGTAIYLILWVVGKTIGWF